MSDEHRTRICSHCYEPMDAHARFCPHCGLVQWRNAWLRAAAVAVPMLLVCVVAMVWCTRLQRRLEAATHPGQPAYTGQIKVTESRMEFGQSPDGPVVLVVGMMKNESDIAWNELNLDVAFYDQRGKLIDVDAKDFSVATIQPHGELAFKLRGPSDLPRETYARYEVTVRSAEDANRPFRCPLPLF
jgi:hypothetical protein